MKKLLSFLAVATLSSTINTNVTSCFLFPKKESIYDNVVNKIKSKSESIKWKNEEVGKDDKVDLSKPSDFEAGKSDLPENWTIMLTDLFGLEANDSPLKNEFHYITDISSADNILKNGVESEVTITVAKYPSKPTEKTSENITKKITWTTGEPSDTELVQETANEINNKTDIYALGINLDADASSDISTKSIVNNIGLTAEQKAITTLSGSLSVDILKSIAFNIKSNAVEDTINKDVTWYKQSPSFTSEYSETTALINGYVYSGSRSNGLYRSLDGVTFESVDTGTFNSKRPISIFQDKDGNVYAGTREKGLYKSTDGTNFSAVDNANLGTKDVSAIFQTSNGDIYVGTSKGENISPSGLWRSTDGGNNFEQIDSLKSLEVHQIAQVNDGSLFAATDKGLYKAEKGSDNFVQVDKTHINEKEVYTIALINKTLYAGTNNGLYASNDYREFTSIGGGIFSSKSIMSITKASDKKLYVGTKSNGLYVSSASSTFKKIDGAKNNEISHIQEFNNTLLLSYDSDFENYHTKGLYYYYLGK